CNQRGLERFHRRRPRDRSDDNYCRRQCATQGRRPRPRGTHVYGNVVVATYHKQISSSSWRLFTMVGGFLVSVFGLGVWMQIVQPLFAAEAATVQGGAKVS